jgi:hypothetical protein
MVSRRTLIVVRQAHDTWLGQTGEISPSKYTIGNCPSAANDKRVARKFASRLFFGKTGRPQKMMRLRVRQGANRSDSALSRGFVTPHGAQRRIFQRLARKGAFLV